MSTSSAAPARSRRAATPARTQHPAAAAPAPSAPARESETPDRQARVAVEQPLSHEEIARLAYALWEARGGQGGSPEEDWLRAEQQLRDRAFAAIS